jgi:predicted RNA binding protein YcfA (HicA-like mRNA interferase family)
MTKRDKLLAKLADKNGRYSLSFEELQTLGRAHGFVITNRDGSHYVFRHPDLVQNVCLVKPHGKDVEVKRPYIRELAEAFEELGLI